MNELFAIQETNNFPGGEVGLKKTKEAFESLLPARFPEQKLIRPYIICREHTKRLCSSISYSEFDFIFNMKATRTKKTQNTDCSCIQIPLAFLYFRVEKGNSVHTIFAIREAFVHRCQTG